MSTRDLAVDAYARLCGSKPAATWMSALTGVATKPTGVVDAMVWAAVADRYTCVCSELGQ